MTRLKTVGPILLISGRRLMNDGGEGLTEDELKERSAYVTSIICRGAAQRVLQKGRATSTYGEFLRAKANAPVPPPPARPVPWIQSGETKRRQEDPELDRLCTEIENALTSVRPGGVRRVFSFVFYDFTGCPELERRWNQAHDEAEERILAARPPLPVKKGEFVEVGGHLLQVRDVNEMRRSVWLVALDEAGNMIAGDTNVPADGLVPVDPQATAATPFPRPPVSMRDGLDRARFVKNQLGSILNRAGLSDDD